MESSEAWARRVQRRLRRRGFKVTLVDPDFAKARKETERRRDLQSLKEGISADKIQQKNSLCKGRARSFRIVDYGGLNGGLD
jgi:transposase